MHQFLKGLLICLFIPLFVGAQKKYLQQDSIANFQANNGYNSIIDGQPANAKLPIFTITGAKVGNEYQYEANIGITPSNHGILRNSLFSVIVPSLNIGEGITDFEKSFGASWLQRWQYERDGKPTISSMLSIQIPYGQVKKYVNYVSTFIIAKNMGKNTVGYFNLYAKTKKVFTVDSISYGSFVGYKWLLPKQKEILIDLLFQSDNGITIESSLEFDFPKGWTISPGINYNINKGKRIFGFGLLVFYQAQSRYIK